MVRHSSCDKNSLLFSLFHDNILKDHSTIIGLSSIRSLVIGFALAVRDGTRMSQREAISFFKTELLNFKDTDLPMAMSLLWSNTPVEKLQEAGV